MSREQNRTEILTHLYIIILHIYENWMYLHDYELQFKLIFDDIHLFICKIVADVI